MAINYNNGTEFLPVSKVKIHNGSDFEEVSRVNALKNGVWHKVFPSKETLTRTYSISGGAIYWGSGNKETSYGSQLIVGSFENGLSTTRRSLIFFPVSDIKADLAGAQILSAELYLKRLNTAHGNPTCSTHIKTHNYSSAPSKWTGSDAGAADSGIPVFTRGQGKWVELLPSVAESIRDGSVKGLCLDADSNYALSCYGRFDRASVKLRITYTKEG